MRFVSALLVSAAILLSELPAVAQISSEAMIPYSVDVAGDWEVVENRAWTLAELGGLESLSGWRRVWESDSRLVAVSYIGGFPTGSHRAAYLGGEDRVASDNGWSAVAIDSDTEAYEIGGGQLMVSTEYGSGVLFVAVVGEDRVIELGQVLTQLRSAEPKNTLKRDPYELSYEVGRWAGRLLILLGALVIIQKVRKRNGERPVDGPHPQEPGSVEVALSRSGAASRFQETVPPPLPDHLAPSRDRD